MNQTFLSFLVIATMLLSSCTLVDRWLIQQDVEAIESAVLENYPYLQVHLRRDKFHWLAHIEELKKHEDVSYSGTNQVQYLSQFLKGLNGHVHILDAQSFPYYAAAYTEIARSNSEYLPWAERLSQGPVLKAYGQTLSTIPKHIDRQLYGSEKYVFTKEARAGVLYLRVPTFDSSFSEVEGPRIVEFLRVSSHPGTMVVFDIRGNGGGSDLFWMNYLVRPLIRESSQQTSVVMYKGGSLSLPYLRAKKTKLLHPQQSMGGFKSLEDVDQYRYYSTEVERIEPSGENIPHGKIVILMDHHNFSASESFVSFAKATGFATTVGRNSGGDGVGFDPILIPLPYSHLVLTLPICAAVNADGKLDYENGTTPDVLLEDGTDSLQYVMAHRAEFQHSIQQEH